MSFNLDDYVDVAERIREFSAKYPDGSLQGQGYFVTEPVVGYHYSAKAYRTPDDPRPGVGTAFEPIPGKTPYTRDSEVQNAETSAWGRAIVALGFNTKKIASRQEVRNRDGALSEPAVMADGEAASAAGSESDPVLTFGKHKGKRLSEAPRDYLLWLSENFEPKDEHGQQIYQAVKDAVIPF